MIKLKELLSETSISMGQVRSNPYATSFKSSEEIKSVNEAKIAHSKGGYVEVGKWYLLNYGKWKDTVKVVSIDSKGMKVYNPNDNWRYTIPMTMIKKKKIGGYMTPIEESVNEKVARPMSYRLRKAQDEIEYMITQGPLDDEDVYSNSGQAMKLLQTAQKALGKIK